MNFSFKRHSELYIIKDGIGYQLNSVADFTFSQTVTEATISRKNLFTSIAPKSIINRRKNLGTGSIEVYFNRECPGIPLLLESLDFASNGNSEYTFDNIYSNQLDGFELVLYNRGSGVYHRFTETVITNLDFGMSPTGISRMVFGVEFADVFSSNPAAVLQVSAQPNFITPKYIDFKLGDHVFPSVTSAAFTITRTINRTTKGANQFNLGSIATATGILVSQYDISALVTSNLGADPLLLNNGYPFTSDVYLGNKVFFIDIPEARITTREEPSEVFKVYFDIKHQSLNPITLGGYS